MSRLPSQGSPSSMPTRTTSRAVLIKAIHGDLSIALLGKARVQDNNFQVILAAVQNNTTIEMLPMCHPAWELKSILAEIAIISTYSWVPYLHTQ